MSDYITDNACCSFLLLISPLKLFVRIFLVAALEPSLEECDITDLTLIDELFSFSVNRYCSVDEVDHVSNTCCFKNLFHFLSLFNAHSHRFLNHNVLSCLSSVNSKLCMCVIRCKNRYDLNVRIIDKIFIICSDLFETETFSDSLSLLFVCISKSNESYIIISENIDHLKSSDMEKAYVSCTNNTNTYCSHYKTS